LFLPPFTASQLNQQFHGTQSSAELSGRISDTQTGTPGILFLHFVLMQLTTETTGRVVNLL
jgi:hypothetical protein